MSNRQEVLLDIKHLSLDLDTAKRYLKQCYPNLDIKLSEESSQIDLKQYISVGVSSNNKVLFANIVKKLNLPKSSSHLTSDIAETYLRQRYPASQIRFCGLSCPEFPYKKCVPFISVAIDGTGNVVSATSFDRIRLPIKPLLLNANTAEKYLKLCYPEHQVRLHGLMYGAFPYQERFPYISVYVDGSGVVLGADKIDSDYSN